MMHMIPKRRGSVLRPSPLPTLTPAAWMPASGRTDNKAGDAAAAPAPIAEYKKLLATMDAHAEILEHAIELRTRTVGNGIAFVELGNDEARELETVRLTKCIA